jgi:hypothetical protein
MNITRKNFDDERLALMDEIAILLLATQTLRGAGEAFENTEDIRTNRTFDTAAPVLKFLENTAVDLLRATFKGRTKRSNLAASTREKSGKTLKTLIPQIEKLAKQEIAIYKDDSHGGKALGTSIRDLVLHPLNGLLSAWSIVQR